MESINVLEFLLIFIAANRETHKYERQFLRLNGISDMLILRMNGH